jgi:hypothetical protein
MTEQKVVFDLTSYIDFSRIHDDTYIESVGLQKMKKEECYFILKYNKQMLNASNYKTLGLLRSVIIKNGKIICFSPPKSIPTELFDLKSLCVDDVLFEEYVEGTMVNLYFDGKDWELATRSSIGAKNNFYNGSQTFRYLFLDAMNQHNFSFDDLNKELCYSFVLKHPQNKIVCHIDKPFLVLCGVYKVCENGFSVEELPVENAILDETLKTPTKISKDAEVDITQEHQEQEHQEQEQTPLELVFDSVKSKYANRLNTSYDIMGFVMKDKKGNRTKVRNPVYEEVRKMRGNQAKKQYTYYNLRKTGNIGKYLSFYPEDATEFHKYRTQLHNYTNTLYTMYVDCFIKKRFSLQDAPFQYKTHLYKLHEKYINELYHQGKYMTKPVVIQYMNDLDPAQIMFCVNYNLRKVVVKKE